MISKSFKSGKAKVFRSALCLLALSVFLIQCTPEVENTGLPNLRTMNQLIINGSPPDQPYHDAVVSLHRVSSGRVSTSIFCSGTLITKRVVLTAAHCLDIANGGKRFKTMSPTSLAVYVGNRPALDLGSHVYAVTEALIHPSYDRQRSLNDIALLRLQRDITESVTPVPHLPASQGLTNSDLGATINFAGFGLNENGTYGIKLQVDGTLQGFGCSVTGCPSLGSTATLISYTQPTSGPCSGDSGGPAFIFRSGVPYVAGVTSYGDRDCVIYGASTRADAFDSWINSFIGTPPPDCSSNGVCNSQCSAGTDPDCAPDCSSDGVCNTQCSAGSDPDCGSNGSCGNGTCEQGESCDGRSGTTSCPQDCSGRVSGKPSRRFCYVNGTCEGSGCP